MTPRERVAAALRLERPDRIPWLEIGVSGHVFAHVIGEPMPAGSGFHPLADVEAYCVYLSQVIRAAGELGLCGVPLKCWNVAFSAGESTTGARAHKRAGAVDGLPSLEEHIATAPRVADMAPIRCAPVYDELMQNTDLFRVLSVGGVYSHAEASMGTAEFAIACHEQPELVQTLCRWMGDRTLEMLDELLARVEPDAILFADDIAFKTSTFISPQMLRRFVFPQYARISERVARAGLPLMFHSDGNLTEVLEDLIGLGIACIHPLENLAMDISWVTETFGQRVCRMGNLDMDIIERLPAAQVHREALDLLERLDGPGYIFASGNSLSPWAPPKNVLAMASAVRQYRSG